MAESRGLAGCSPGGRRSWGGDRQHVRRSRLDKDVLVVTVDHPAWATQVRRLGDDLLDRVAETTTLPRPALDVRSQDPAVS